MSSVLRFRRCLDTRIMLCAATRVHAESSASTERDSADVRIVENARPLFSAASAWTLSAKRILLFGSGDAPAYTFSRVGAATRLADGRIVVSERADVHLRVFDSTGRYLRTVGAKGKIPANSPALVS